MATLAALLKHRGHDVSGSDEHVYPPMSDFLRGRRHPRARRLSRRAHRRRRRPGGRRQRHLARQRRARGRARSRAPLLLAARGDPRPLPVGRALDRDRRHARQDHDDVAGRLAADRTAAPIRRCWSAASPATSATAAPAIAMGKGKAFVIEGDEYDSAFFDKTAKFLKYLPDIAVVNNIEFDHADIYRRPRRGAAGVPPARESRAAPRPDAARRRQPRRGGAGGARRAAASQTFGLAPAARHGARIDIRAAASSGTQRFACSTRATTSGVFTLPLLGAHNVRNALAAHRRRRRPRPRRATGCARGSRLSRASSAGSKSSASARGVTVYDDFAHHPTAVAETLAARARGRRQAGGSGRSSSRARRRRAGACFRTTSRAPSAAPTKW